MLTLTVSGTVSDYADTSSLRQNIATAAGVEDASLVTISVAAASVIITATIAVPASTTASAVQSALASELSSAAAASTALGITVEGTPIVVLADSGGVATALHAYRCRATAGLFAHAPGAARSCPQLLLLLLLRSEAGIGAVQDMFKSKEASLKTIADLNKKLYSGKLLRVCFVSAD